MDPINIEADRIQLCIILRSLAEEWGNEHFEMHLPRQWARFINARDDFQFITDDSLILFIGSQQNIFRREIKLAPAACLSVFA